MAIDARFSQYIRTLIGDDLDIVDHYKVGQLPLEIDLILKKSKNSKLITLKNRGMGTFAQIFEDRGVNTLVVEYKSRNDAVSPEVLYKLQGYRFFYIQKNLKSIPDPEGDISSVLILTKPKKFIHKYNKRKMSPGIYRLDLVPTLYLIVINELEVCIENYGLLMFAIDKKLRIYVRNIVKSIDDTAELFKSFAYVYNNKEYTMAIKQENIDLDELDELDVATPIRSFGVKKAIDQLGIETVIDAVGIKEVINAVGTKKVIEAIGIEELNKNLTDDQLNELIAMRKSRK